MRTVNNMLQAAQRINLQRLIEDNLTEYSEQYLLLQKEQLYEGKMSTGNDLSPSYFEDPYFKTPAAAARYSAWKDKITPNPKRSQGTPNLFINGFLYSKFIVEVKTEGYLVDNTSETFPSIIMKYGPELVGLDNEKKQLYITIARPMFMRNMIDEMNVGVGQSIPKSAMA